MSFSKTIQLINLEIPSLFVSLPRFTSFQDFHMTSEEMYDPQMVRDESKNLDSSVLDCKPL